MISHTPLFAVLVPAVGALLIALTMGRVFLARGTQSSQPLAAAAGLDPQRIAVYHTGRNPLPYRLLDKDSDGRPDHLRVKFVPDANQAWLVFVSPGEASPAELPAGGHEVPVTYQ